MCTILTNAMHCSIQEAKNVRRGIRVTLSPIDDTVSGLVRLVQLIIDMYNSSPTPFPGVRS